MNAKTIQIDNLLITAGECYMFLLWSETAMCDLVVLKDGGKEMRSRYFRELVGQGHYPRDFARKRLELNAKGFTEIKSRFLSHWPEWDREIRDSIERVVIWRNALGHANVQPFRGYLLYTPSKASWESIDEYTRCHQCSKYRKDCECSLDEIGEPRSIAIRDETIQTIYLDIRTVDVECLYPTAASLDVPYRGIAWPTEDGTSRFVETGYSGSEFEERR